MQLKKYYCCVCGDFICYETINKQIKTKNATITITKLNKVKDYYFTKQQFCKECYNKQKKGN